MQEHYRNIWRAATPDTTSRAPGLKGISLQNYFKIETDNKINPKFPGYLVYMDIFSEAYHIKQATVEDAAAMLTLAYWGGVLEKDLTSRDEMKLLGCRLVEFIKSSQLARKFDPRRGDLYLSRIEDFS